MDPGTALTQDTLAVSGSAEPGDEFGAAVAWIAPGLGDRRTRPHGGDRFGASVAMIAGAGERVLLVGVPGDTSFTTGMVNPSTAARHGRGCQTARSP